MVRAPSERVCKKYQHFVALVDAEMLARKLRE
jgi:hypothetical protein